MILNCAREWGFRRTPKKAGALKGRRYKNGLALRGKTLCRAQTASGGHPRGKGQLQKSRRDAGATKSAPLPLRLFHNNLYADRARRALRSGLKN